MFCGAGKFNQPIGEWNTSNVADMSGMFELALHFNQPVDKWDTSKVTNMSDIFNYAGKFNRMA